jgi:hypothetical protein|nr:MAG TPA: hypothetical protein [Caudoviricetes sp.]
MSQTITLDEIADKVSNLQRSAIKSIFQEIIESLREEKWAPNGEKSYYVADYLRLVEIDIERNEILFAYKLDNDSILTFIFNDDVGVKLKPSDFYIYDGLVYDLSETIKHFLRSEARIVKEITNNLLTYSKGVSEQWHTS